MNLVEIIEQFLFYYFTVDFCNPINCMATSNA